MSIDSSFRSLRARYDRTKSELRQTESTIRHITGRDPDFSSSNKPGSQFPRPSSSSFVGRKRSYPYKASQSKRSSSYDEESFDDEEEEEEEDDEGSPKKKPTLQSTVVASKKIGRSRKAAIEEGNNSNIKARNRRMFGALIGTLEKFQDEEKKRKHKELKRAEIEKKVEAATEEEKERIKKEKEMLFKARRDKQDELQCLEKKMERAESHEVFKENHENMMMFMKTKAKPPVFFLPAIHTATTKKYFDHSRAKIQDFLQEKKDDLERDLADIDEMYKKDIISNEMQSCAVEKEEAKSPKAESDEESSTTEQDISDDDNDSSVVKNPTSVADQDFEPIYD